VQCRAIGRHRRWHKVQLLLHLFTCNRFCQGWTANQLNTVSCREGGRELHDALQPHWHRVFVADLGDGLEKPLQVSTFILALIVVKHSSRCQSFFIAIKHGAICFDWCRPRLQATGPRSASYNAAGLQSKSSQAMRWACKFGSLVTTAKHV